VIPTAEQERILPIAPDFVIELRSPSDRLEDLLAKMQEYADSGVRLGWLIDPLERRCYELRPGRPMTTSLDPNELSGDPELPGFRLDLSRIWRAARDKHRGIGHGPAFRRRSALDGAGASR